MTLVVPSAAAAAKTGLEMGLFEAMDADDGKPKSAARLAEICKADEVLVSRLLKHLAAVNLVSETGPNIYEATLFTSSMQHRAISSTLEYLHDMSWPMFADLSGYLKKTHYKNPVDPVDGPWQHAIDSPGTHLWAWLGANPKKAKNFSDTMAGFTADKQAWTEIFPTEEVMRDGSGEAADVVIVDVGGNIGSDLERFLVKHPEAKGRAVLQDLEHVLGTVEAPEGVKCVPHDFFNPQPVHGARIYLLHAVLHDWPDKDCLRILAALKPAFTNRSRLLITEMVIPSTGANPLTTAMDLTMMACLSSYERTEEAWNKLLTDAGYKMTKIHRGRLESVVEATLP